MKDKSMGHNNPTIPELMVNEVIGGIAQEKSRWISLLHKYESYNYADNSFIHPFFAR